MHLSRPVQKSKLRLLGRQALLIHLLQHLDEDRISEKQPLKTMN